MVRPRAPPLRRVAMAGVTRRQALQGPQDLPRALVRTIALEVGVVPLRRHRLRRMEGMTLMMTTLTATLEGQEGSSKRPLPARG